MILKPMLLHLLKLSKVMKITVNNNKFFGKIVKVVKETQIKLFTKLNKIRLNKIEYKIMIPG